MSIIINSKIILSIWKIKNGYLFHFGYNDEIIDSFKPPVNKIIVGKNEKNIEISTDISKITCINLLLNTFYEIKNLKLLFVDIFKNLFEEFYIKDTRTTFNLISIYNEEIKYIDVKNEFWVYKEIENDIKDICEHIKLYLPRYVEIEKALIYNNDKLLSLDESIFEFENNDENILKLKNYIEEQHKYISKIQSINDNIKKIISKNKIKKEKKELY